jgi:hypothetical protein
MHQMFEFILEIVLRIVFEGAAIFAQDRVTNFLDKRQRTRLGLTEAEWALPWRARRRIILERAKAAKQRSTAPSKKGGHEVGRPDAKVQ